MSFAVDLIAHAVDNSASSTLVLISGDRVLAYALSILRLRCYRVVVIAPDAAHPSILAHASLSFNWGLDVLYPSGSSPTPAKYPGGVNTKDRWRFGGLPTTDGDDLDPSTFNFPRHSQPAHVNGQVDSGSDQSDTQEYRGRTPRPSLKPRNPPEAFSSPLLSREAPPSQTPRVPPTRTFATRAVSTDPIPVSPPKVYESRGISPVRHAAQVRVTRATSPIPQQTPDHPVTSLPQSPPTQSVSHEPTEPSPPSEPKPTYATRAVLTDPVLVLPLKVHKSRATSPICLPVQPHTTSAELPVDEVLDRSITRLPTLPPIQDLPLEGAELPLSHSPALVVDQVESPSAAKSGQDALGPSPLPGSEPLAAVESKSKSVVILEESITDTKPSSLNRKVECVEEPPSPPFRYPSISDAFIPGPNPIPQLPVALKHPPPEQRLLGILQPARKVERVDEGPLPSFRYPSISETFIPDPNPILRSPGAPNHSQHTQRPSLETLQRLVSLGKERSGSLPSPKLNPSGAEFVPKGMTWTFPSPAVPPMESEGPPTLGVLRPLPLGIQQPPPMGMQFGNFGDDFLEPLRPPTHYSTPPATNMSHPQPDRLESGPLVNPPNHTQRTAPVSQGMYQGPTVKTPEMPKVPPPTPLLPLKPPIPPAARVAPGPPSVIPPAFRPLVKALHGSRSQNIIRPLQSAISAKVGGKATYQLAGVVKFSRYLDIAKEQGLVETGGSSPREWVALHPHWVHVPCT